MTKMGFIHTGHGARRVVPGLSVVAVLVASLCLAAPALATKPTGPYINFGDCPVTNPVVVTCLFAQTTSGEFKIGSTTVPLTKTITLQSGLRQLESETLDLELVGATDGNTLSKTPQTVPGGLLKIVAPEFFPLLLQNIFNEFINKGITGVTATTELVGNPHLFLLNALFESGTALSLPVRVHLENPFLGEKCFIGSKANPVNVELTTGTTSPPPPNTPISGKAGELSEVAEVLIIKNNSLVNNSFSAPAAEGCGSQILFGLFTGIIDSAVDSQLGLPSAAGHNTAILNGSQELASAEAVKASEK
jgi:hypothetical protein